MPASYIVISPVKDEETHVQTTIESMLAQTVKPERWIIVDDGSADRTAEIVERYTREHGWITLVRLPRRAERRPGSPVVRAFHAGFALVRRESYDFVVKLDCDLRLRPEYFERLLARFEQDARLGIASGVYAEQNGAEWKPVPMPAYHASGASKVIRARCFEEIGGFVESRGWDTVDEIRAQARGWTTRHFPDLVFDHLRPEGSSRGPLYTSRMHGEVYYLTGGSWEFFLLKVAHRIIAGRPPVLAGLMLFAGYLRLWLLRRERLVSKEEARFYQRALRRRMRDAMSGAAARLRPGFDSGRQL